MWGQPAQKTPLPVLLHVDFTAAEMCLLHRCVAMSVVRTTEIASLLLFAFSSVGMCLLSSCLAEKYCGFQASCYKYRLQCGGQAGTLWQPWLYICWHRHFTFDQNSEFSLRKKRGSFTSSRLIENFNSDNLCSKPMCHVISKAFSVSKNTGAIDMILLKFKMTSISLIQ
jgi:hypothetical protein